MTKIIVGKNAVLGRLSSYAAKEALKGEDIVILNCEQVIITGNKKSIKKNFETKRSPIKYNNAYWIYKRKFVSLSPYIFLKSFNHSR